MKLSPVRRTLLLALPLGIVIGAAGALAADAKLDEADTHVDRAINALKAAVSPKHKNEFGGHGRRAVELLEEVKREIKKAKIYDDQHPGEDKPGGGKPGTGGPKPGPTASGPGGQKPPDGKPGMNPKPGPTASGPGGQPPPNPRPGPGGMNPKPGPTASGPGGQPPPNQKGSPKSGGEKLPSDQKQGATQK